MDMILPPLAFFGVGDQEMIVIMVVVLILFGGKKMPDFARGLGKTLKELRKATGEVEREFKRVMDEAENLPPKAPFTMPSVLPPAVPAAPVTPLTPATPAIPAAPVAPTASEPPHEEDRAPKSRDEPPPDLPQEYGGEFHSDI
jgi:sec-independent protein translocase protein TatA